MAAYPRTQSEISVLVKSMIAGYSEHPGYFPSADVAALETARNQHHAASEALSEAQAAAKIAAAQKAKTLKQLQAVTKAQLKKSQVDTAGNPRKLGFIGWGPKANPQSMQAPSSPTNLKIIAQGFDGKDNEKGILHLSWKKSAFERARFVRFYSVERRQLQSNGNGQATFGPWGHISSTINNEIALKNEPTSSRLEYRVRAVNKGGQSYPTNVTSVIL